MSGLGMRLGLNRFAQNAALLPSYIIDKSGEDWTPLDLDDYLIELNPDNYVGKHFIFPLGVPRTYLSDAAVALLLAEENENSMEVAGRLANTDDLIEWLADWVEDNSITQTQIDMDDYDACTAASETDRGRFATEENENSFINLEIE
jgi:hypothetical protein